MCISSTGTILSFLPLLSLLLSNKYIVFDLENFLKPLKFMYKVAPWTVVFMFQAMTV